MHSACVRPQAPGFVVRPVWEDPHQVLALPGVDAVVLGAVDGQRGGRSVPQGGQRAGKCFFVIDELAPTAVEVWIGPWARYAHYTARFIRGTLGCSRAECVIVAFAGRIFNRVRTTAGLASRCVTAVAGRGAGARRAACRGGGHGLLFVFTVVACALARSAGDSAGSGEEGEPVRRDRAFREEDCGHRLRRSMSGLDRVRSFSSAIFEDRCAYAGGSMVDRCVAVSNPS